MKSKVFNIVVLAIFLGFSVFFGVNNYKLNLETAQQDSLFEAELSAEVNDITKEIADDINITNANKAANERGSTSGSAEDGNVDVYFNNFYEMYDYAVNKYNNATYVYTSASGTAALTGSVSGITIDTNASLSFVKAKENKERYFSFILSGEKVLEGFNKLNILTKHYTNGTIYQYNVGSVSPTNLTKSQYEETMNWDMTQIFHLADASLADSLTESEIISFMYDDNAKEYTAKVEINTSHFTTNYASVMQSITNGDKPASFSKIAMTIKVDDKGNFKSISYIEKYSAQIKYAGLSISGAVETNYTESFTVIDSGFVDVKNPF